MKVQLIFLGAPGSGKGTQASYLVSELGHKHISTGNILRQEVDSGTALGKKVENLMNAGQLVDDMTMLELLKVHCDLTSTTYIFDGFPRNKKQAELLDEEILQKAPSMAIYFSIDSDQLISRLVGRRICRQCGEIYNLAMRAPKQEGVCDQCGAHELLQRKDDDEAVVKARMEIFKSTIGPVLTYYGDQGRLQRVDASAPPEIVFEKLKEAL